MEQVIRVVKCVFGSVKVRYRGLAKRMPRRIFVTAARAHFSWSVERLAGRSLSEGEILVDSV